MTVVGFLPIIWLSVILAAIFCEAVTEKLVAVWFAPAAAAAFVCGLFKISAGEQTLVFISLALACISVTQAVKALIALIKKHKTEGGDIQ